MSKLRITKLNEEVVDYIDEHIVQLNTNVLFALINKDGSLYLEEGQALTYCATYEGENKVYRIGQNLEAYFFFKGYCERKNLEFKEIELNDILSGQEFPEHTTINITEMMDTLDFIVYDKNMVEISNKKIYKLYDSLNSYLDACKNIDKLAEKFALIVCTKFDLYVKINPSFALIF